MTGATMLQASCRQVRCVLNVLTQWAADYSEAFVEAITSSSQINQLAELS